MLIVGFRGTALAEGDPILRAIAAGELGGVILFDRDGLTHTGGRNITSPAQLAALAASLRAAWPAGTDPRGLIVAIDQEGGRVARLNSTNGYAATPSEAALGAADDVEHTSEVAATTAGWLAAAGITLNLAPVVDLDVNPDSDAIGALDRSFSGDPDVVVRHSAAVIEAHHVAGVGCAIKHFPGEGSGAGNTDFGVVDVTSTWSPTELQPFRELIAAGLPDAIMVGHIVNGQLDPDRPASLSGPTIATLRDDLGWTGATVSDDLQAAAITQAFGAGEAIALAIEAGLDLLLLANQQVDDPDIVEHTISTIEGLVANGRITEARLDASVARIERMVGSPRP